MATKTDSNQNDAEPEEILEPELEKEEALLLPRITGKILQNLVYNRAHSS